MALKKTFFGKDISFWIGKIVNFDAQKAQLSGAGGEEYWGWRYKVRIIGEYSENDDVPDIDVHTAVALLPTTGGTGAAGRFSSVKLSQGDMVFGAFLAPNKGFPVILSSFGRNEDVTDISGKFAIESGYGASETVEPTGITGTQEFSGNKQVETPALGGPSKGPGNDERKSPDDSLKEQGISTEKEPVDGAIPEPKTPLTKIGKDFAINDITAKNINELKKLSTKTIKTLDDKFLYTDKNGVKRVRLDSPLMEELKAERVINKASSIFNKVNRVLNISNSREVAQGTSDGADASETKEVQYKVGRESERYDAQIYNADKRIWEDPSTSSDMILFDNDGKRINSNSDEFYNFPLDSIPVPNTGPQYDEDGTQVNPDSDEFVNFQLY